MVAVSRTVRYLVRNLMDRGQTVIDGIKIVTDERIVGADARKLLIERSYEQPERDLVRAAIQPGDRVLEFGGCLGLLSLLCARIVGRENVLCYEPNPSACAAIRANCDLNGIQLRLRQKAITADGGPIAFFLADNLISSSIYERESIGRISEVESDPFADVIREWAPTALVVDIEGAECEILPTSDLACVRKIILETHVRIVGKERTDALMAGLASKGFEVKAHRGRRVFLAR